MPTSKEKNMADKARRPTKTGEVLAAILTTDEARSLTDEVKQDARALWKKLLRLYEGEAHKALGYSSWADYYEAEFGKGRSRAYQLLNSGKVLAAIEKESTTVEPPRNEAQARELAPLLEQPDEMRAAWEEASKEGEPTAAKVRAAVQARTKEPGEELDAALHEQAKEARDYWKALERAQEHGRKKAKRAPDYPTPPSRSLRPLLTLAERRNLQPVENMIAALSGEPDSTLLDAMKAVVRNTEAAEEYVVTLIDAETDAKLPG